MGKPVLKGKTEAAGAGWPPAASGQCGGLVRRPREWENPRLSAAWPEGMGLSAEVSSPTFALVHEYGGTPPLVHFDMYRVNGWEDLDSTGFFDYIGRGAVLAVEWSENIEAALPPDAIRVRFEALGETKRRITVTGVEEDRCG